MCSGGLETLGDLELQVLMRSVAVSRREGVLVLSEVCHRVDPFVEVG